MHNALEIICSELDQLVTAVISLPSDEPFGIAHGNWSFPSITRSELGLVASSLAEEIRDRGSETLGGNEKRILDYPRRLIFLRNSTVPQIWGSAGNGVPTYLITLDGLKNAVQSALKSDAQGEAAQSLKRQTQQLRGMEARLRDLQPRSVNIHSMVERIESAYDAADKLPADLEALSDSREKVGKFLTDAEKDRVLISAARERVDELKSIMEDNAKEAAAVIAHCQQAYATATSQGLAAAFAERSKSLDHSMWAWVIGLTAALALGSALGTAQLHGLRELVKAPEVGASVVFVNLVLAALSVGAPIWFGWLATKQIGQRFRLSEDYAFKASISRAYEGYRREAARIDPDLEVRLLSSALTRLDELPLRLVEPISHGSPWHELASSEAVKAALKSIPEFADSVKESALEALRVVAARKGGGASSAAEKQ